MTKIKKQRKEKREKKAKPKQIREKLFIYLKKTENFLFDLLNLTQHKCNRIESARFTIDDELMRSYNSFLEGNVSFLLFRFII